MKFAKYITIITILTLIISICGCLNNNDNQDMTKLEKNTNGVYSVEGISFKCPDNWSVFRLNAGNITIIANPMEKTNETNYTSTGSVIQTENGKMVMKSPNTQFKVSIFSFNGMSNQEAINYVEKNMIAGEKKVSSSVIKLDGNKAFKEEYYTNISNTIVRSEYIYFVKNGKTYILEFEAPKDFEKEKTNFDIIINSFEVD